MTEAVGASILETDVRHMILVPLEGTFLQSVLAPWVVHTIMSWVIVSHIFSDWNVSFKLD